MQSYWRLLVRPTRVGLKRFSVYSVIYAVKYIYTVSRKKTCHYIFDYNWNKNCLITVILVHLLPPTKKEVNVFARVRSFVCMSVSKITQKSHAWIWMKCCVSTDVGKWTNWLTFEPDPDHSPDAGTGKSENRWSVEVCQTCTSFKPGYRSRDALQRDTVRSFF